MIDAAVPGSAPVLSSWENFYVIVGSSAAALTGLQFVVMTLISDDRRRAGTNEIDTFGTPTVVHFGVVLLLSAILSAPWMTKRNPAILLGVVGVAGVLYSAIVTRRATRTRLYTPVLEDWIFHAILPFVAYALLLGGAIAFPRHETDALFAIATTTLLLLFIGIHNAWDTVTFLALDDAAQRNTAASQATRNADREVATPTGAR